MQVGFARPAINAVKRDELVLLGSRTAQQQIGLLLIGAYQLGIAKNLIGPQAAPTVTGLTPEQ